MLEAAIKLRQQLVGALAYPLFVLISTPAAAGVILLAVAVAGTSHQQGASKRAADPVGLLAASRLLREQGSVLAGGFWGGGAAGLGPESRWLAGRPARN